MMSILPSGILGTTHERIAKNIGSAREAVSRVLKRFSSAGYVTVLRGGVKLRDTRALRAIPR